MADTVVSDAAKFPQDEGYPNIADGSETWDSAGHLGTLAMAGQYPHAIGGLTFTGHDGTNDQADVTAGSALLKLDVAVTTQSGVGGSSAPSYDTTLATNPFIAVELPTNVTNLSLTSATLNDVWLAYATDGTVTNVSTGDVWLRHGSGLSAPPHPNIKLGQVNPDDAGADILNNRAPDGQKRHEIQRSVSGASSYTFNLLRNWDMVRVEIGQIDTPGTSINDLGIQVEGDAGSNYNVRFADGTTGSNNAAYSSLGNLDESFGNSFINVEMSGRWNSRHDLAAMQGTQANVVTKGHNGNVTSPLTQITLLNNSNTENWSADVDVYGWEIG